MTVTAEQTSLTTGGEVGYLRIAAEEAYAPPELFEIYHRMLDGGSDNLSFSSLMGHYLKSQAERPRFVRDRLQDIGAKRLSDMDSTGIDHAA